MDWLLAIVLLLPPFIFLDSASRYFNVKIAALELIFSIIFLSQKNIKMPKVNYKVMSLVLVFILWISITIFFAEQKTYAFNRNLCVVMHILFGYSVWGYLHENSYRRNYIVYLMAFSFFFPAVCIIVYGLILKTTSTPLWSDLPFYSNIRHLGYHVTASLIFAVLIFTRSSNTPIKITLGLWVFVAIAFLLWSGSRGPIAALFLTGITLLLIVPNFRTRIVTFTISFSVILLFVMFVFKIEFMGYGLVNRTLSSNTIDSLLAGRVKVWSGALQSVENWLLGIGGDNFILLKAAGHLAQAHNVIIQAILDWGLIGAMMFSALLSMIIISAILIARSVKGENHTIVIACLGLLLTYILLSMVDGVFYHGVPFMLFVVSAALMFSCRSSFSKEYK